MNHTASTPGEEAGSARSLRDRIIEGELELDGTHPPTLMFLMAEHWKAVASEYRAKANDYDRLKLELRLARLAIEREAALPLLLPDSLGVPASPSGSTFQPSVSTSIPNADAAEAARYRWLRGRLFGADFDYDGECVVIFTWPRNAGIGANLDASVDGAMTEGF